MVKFNMSSYNKIINEKGKGGDHACLRLQCKNAFHIDEKIMISFWIKGTANCTNNQFS